MSSTSNSTNLKRAGSDMYAPDLQTVYRRILHTSLNTVTPSLRSKTSGQQRPHTQPSISSGKLEQAALHYETEPNPLRVSDTHQLSSSTEEIVIKQLPFHVRERPVTSSTSTRTHSADTSNSNTTHSNRMVSVTAFRKPEKLPPGHRLRNMISDHWASVYSEQSMRYVTEQVALEQARQRKKLAGLQNHRIDRKYLVNGSGFFSSPAYHSRSNSAIISRVLYQNRYSRPYQPGYMYRPRPQIDLVINGCARLGCSEDTDKIKSIIKMDGTCEEAKAVNQDAVSVPDVKPDVAEISNSFKAAMSSVEMGSVSVNDEAKLKDKPVRSVTFILPSEDSLAV